MDKNLWRDVRRLIGRFLVIVAVIAVVLFGFTRLFGGLPRGFLTEPSGPIEPRSANTPKGAVSASVIPAPASIPGRVQM